MSNKVLVLRPESSKGRFNACGYTVDEKLGKSGGFYVESVEIAKAIVEELEHWAIKGWTWVQVDTSLVSKIAAPEPIQASPVLVPNPGPVLKEAPVVPEKKSKGVYPGAAERRALQGRVKAVVAAGGPPIKLNLPSSELEAYLEAHTAKV